ncbi:MAG: polysaccharide biosynthesis C-terminal domain-containing protein [Rhizobiaceae bacterium]
MARFPPPKGREGDRRYRTAIRPRILRQVGGSSSDAEQKPIDGSTSATTQFECPKTGLRILRASCNLETVKDGRGVILTYLPDEPIREFNIVHFRPTSVRGMHYHSHFIEYSLAVAGEGVFVYREVRDDPFSEKSFFVARGFCVRIPVGVVHTIYSISELTVVACLSKPWDESHPPIVQMGAIPKPERIG